MDDTIYRQITMNALKEHFGHNENRIESMFTSDVYWHDDTVLNVIRSVPSAQPEIVRCKDCKWSDWYTAVDGKRYCYCMETGNSGRTENDFCSYAERRTDG